MIMSKVISKQCSKCNETKLVSEFAKHKTCKYGLSSICKICKKNCYDLPKDVQKQRSKEYRGNNLEKLRNREKQYRLNNQIAVKQRKKNYYQQNKERILQSRKTYYETNKEVISKKISNYKKLNAGNFRSYNAKRKAIKKQAVALWANFKVIEKLYEEAAFYTRVSGEKYHVDHIDPLQSPLVCGLHVENNLRVVEETFNLSKGNRFVPYRIDQNGKRYLIKVPDKWLRKCQSYYELMTGSDND